MNYLRNHPLSLTGIVSVALFALTPIAFAEAATGTPTSFVQSIITFIDTAVIPTIFALAFVFLVFGIYRYFILGGANEEKRKEGQQFVTWALIGLVLMFSVWGIIRLLTSTLGFSSQARPDYATFGPAQGDSKSTGTSLPVAK